MAVSDRVGMVAACACACHCVAIGWLVGAMPVLGLALANPVLELALTGGALAISGAAILLGRAHGSGWRPLAFFLSGAALLAAAVITDGVSQLLHISLVLSGASLIVTAHILNGRAGARHETTCCSGDTPH